MEDRKKRYLNLWHGGEGDMASLMDTEDTHMIYMVTADMKSKLTGLIEKRINPP